MRDPFYGVAGVRCKLLTRRAQYDVCMKDGNQVHYIREGKVETDIVDKRDIVLCVELH